MMGKRKLRFDARKNYERKKYSRNASVMVAVESEVKLEVLKISLPISVYHEAAVPDISILHDRLQRSSVLTAQWMCSFVSDTSVVLSKLRIEPPKMSAEVSFLLTISSNFLWILCIGRKEVDASQCRVLSHFSTTLRSVREVLSVLTALDRSTFCIGNSNKFDSLIQHYKGEFRDKSGRLCILFKQYL